MNPYGITLTLVVFYAFSELHRRKRASYTNPVLLSITAIAGILWASGYSYESYMESAVILKFLLGPAVVSLAVPVYKGRKVIVEYWREITAGIAIGGTLAILSAFYTAKLLGGTEEVLLSIAPKSVTTAIAIGISEKIGGIPALTAVLVILTGVLGNAVGVEILDAAGVRDRIARGLAMGRYFSRSRHREDNPRRRVSGSGERFGDGPERGLHFTPSSLPHRSPQVGTRLS